jgi:hypothetical protein
VAAAPTPPDKSRKAARAEAGAANRGPGTKTSWQQQAAATRGRTTFKGNTEGMSGHVFECYEEQDDRRQYGKTVEALDAYARKTLLYAADLAPLFGTVTTTPNVARPENIADDADKLDEVIFLEEVKEYVKRTRALMSNLATILP